MATPAQLLERFKPVIVLTPGEAFAPERVDGFIADSTVVGGSYDQTSCKPNGGPAARACYSAADKSHAEPPSVYGAVFRSGGKTVLEYWFFYYFDLYQFANPLAPVWQDHEGDWEAVAVVLGAKSAPLLVGTSRHCAGAQRAWAKVRRRGDRPVIYVARGSHANYFGPGLQFIPNRCLPPQAASLLDRYHVRLPDIVRVGADDRERDGRADHRELTVVDDVQRSVGRSAVRADPEPGAVRLRDEPDRPRVPRPLAAPATDCPRLAVGVGSGSGLLA